MTDHPVADAEVHKRSRFGDLFSEFDSARLEQKHDWHGQDPRESEHSDQRGVLGTLSPVGTDFHDAHYVLTHSKWRRASSEPDVVALTRFYGGSAISGYKTAMADISTNFEISTDPYTPDVTYTIPRLIEVKSVASRRATVAPTPAVVDRERFARLADQWEAETATSSNLDDMVLHASYQHVIGMGPAVLPLILSRLEAKADYWFWALVAIAGEDPGADAKDFSEARDAWLAWGRAKGMLASGD